MNRRTISLALASLLLTLGKVIWAAAPPVPTPPAMPPPAAPATTNGIGPKIRFETTMHDFGKVKSGEVAKYTYAFTNGGDQVLELSGVQACGCITAEYTKRVEPGQTGSIPIRFNSGGYGGPITKTIIVTCNDRSNSRPMLQFKGVVWRPIDVIPQFVVLNLTADAPLAAATVLITNNLPEPVDFFPPRAVFPLSPRNRRQSAWQGIDSSSRRQTSAGGQCADSDHTEDLLDQYA